jgi:hypothetical protein
MSHIYSLLRNWYFEDTCHVSPHVSPHHGSWTIQNSFRLPIGMSPGQPWAPPPNAWS